MIVLLALPGRPDVGRTVLFAVAALAGELSIGWSNDGFDAPADTAAGRTGKPIVAGLVSRRQVAMAAVIALVLGAVAAFLVSIPTGLINLVMMAAGWAYNAGLKATPLSGLTYVVGFGLIPAFAASVRPGHPWPQAWITGAAALLGLGGHFANVLPDLAADRISGVRGLPQRIAAGPAGATTVRVVTVALLLGASVLIVLAPGGPLRWWQLGGLVVAGGLAVTGVVSRGRTPFLAAIAIAVLDVVLFVTRGASLT